MGRKIAIFFLVFFAAAGTHGFQEAKQWIKLSPSNGRFTVLMPGKPSSETQHYGEYTDHSFIADTGLATYEVGYSELTKTIPDAELALDFARNALLLLKDSKLLSETKISLSGYSGREIKVASIRGI